MSDIVVYNDGELELKVSVNEETIWLTQKQLVELFEVTKQNISLHINNIFKEDELNKNSTVKFFLTVQQEGKRKVERNLEHYNLDMIISLGYRVNSKKATKFRQWATSVLKNYIQNGYAINTHKITEQRLLNLENDVGFIKSQLKNNTLEPKQGVFFDGQIYDAYAFVSELIKKATQNIIIIDNYIDDTVLTLLSKNTKVTITIYTKIITKQLRLDEQKYNAQYKNLTIKEFELSHDRFIIIDNDIYHIGASLKDLGKKWFAFSKMDNKSVAILERLK
jgi:prophage antirepressor-like protein